MSMPLPGDFSSASSSSTSPLSISSKSQQQRFDAASFLHSNFYEFAAAAAAHAAAQAAAFHSQTNLSSTASTATINHSKATVTPISVNESSDSKALTTSNTYSTFQDFASSLATQAAV
jgi:hypothetical protein